MLTNPRISVSACWKPRRQATPLTARAKKSSSKEKYCVSSWGNPQERANPASKKWKTSKVALEEMDILFVRHVIRLKKQLLQSPICILPIKFEWDIPCASRAPTKFGNYGSLPLPDNLTPSTLIFSSNNQTSLFFPTSPSTSNLHSPQPPVPQYTPSPPPSSSNPLQTFYPSPPPPPQTQASAPYS